MEEDRSKVPETVSDDRPESLASHGTNDYAVITSLKPAVVVGEETDENSQGGVMEGDTVEDRAVRFLLNASVSDLDLSQKLYFLESKGFTSPQIQSILHQLRTVQNGHLEETFQKTFGVPAIAPVTTTRAHHNGMNFISPTNHQRLVQPQNVNSGVGNVAIIGLISGIATMVGMAGWRWLNGGDFELIPPPRIISKIKEQQKITETNETHHHAETKSNDADIDDDYLGMNFYENENNSIDVLKKKEEEDIQEEEKRIKSKALTNSAMDYLLRRKKSSHGVENNAVQLTVQDQILSMEQKLSDILDSVKAKASSNNADRQKSEHETIAKLEQMKMLLSTINNLPCEDDSDMGIKQSTDDAQEEIIEQTHNVAINQGTENDQSIILDDMQDDKHKDMHFSDNLSTRVQGNLSSCSLMPFMDTSVPSSTDIIYSQSKEEYALSNPNVTAKDTSHFTQHDASAPPNPKNEEEDVLANPTTTLNDTNHTTLQDASAPPNPTVTFSFCKDDGVFVECVRQLLQHNNESVSDLITTLSTIQMYCNNILKYKDTHSSSRFCKIYTNNPTFKKYIQQTKGAVELLESIGFGKASWESNTNDISNALKWTMPSRWAVEVIRGVDGVDSCDREQIVPVLDGFSYLRNVSEELNFIKQQISTRTAEGDS